VINALKHYAACCPEAILVVAPTGRAAIIFSLVTAVKTNRLGMHVMIVKNLDTTKKAANGTIGQITSIIFDDSNITNDTILSDELQITTIMHSHLPKFISIYISEFQCYYDIKPSEYSIKCQLKNTLTALPINPAYAFTIKKMSSSEGAIISIAGGSLPLFVTGGGARSDFGLVVIQEWWGLNDQIKAVTERLADAGGFKAVAPDLYHGKKATDADEANHLMSKLDWPGAIKDIQSATDYLKKEAGCRHVAVLGFCMGGALAIASAVKVKGLEAAVCFYGIPGRDFAKAEEIKCPLQCHFGSLDTHTGFSDVKSVDQLEKHLATQKDFHYEIHRYPDANHAFMNETRPEVYNDAVAKDATNRSINFIKKIFTSK